jgi:itaconate CoA-transferase
MTNPRPLDGITVVSLEHAIAAPFCTRQLADLGARVIKVERPGAGDFARGYDERVRGLASHFVWTNRSKESLTLDLKQEEAGTILDTLLADADVLVQNLAPGAAARMGLSFEALHERFPRLTLERLFHRILKIHDHCVGTAGQGFGESLRSAPGHKQRRTYQ